MVLITCSTSQKGGKLDRTQFFRVFQTVGQLAGLPVEKRQARLFDLSRKWF